MTTPGSKPSPQSLDGLLGLIESDLNGDILRSHGEDAEALGAILMYFQQMADSIGETFGSEPMDEARIIGKSTTAVCIAKPESTLGLIFSSRARISEILPLVLET